MTDRSLDAIRHALAQITADERVPADTLGGFVRDAFIAAGLDATDATIATDAAVYAQLHGTQSHGVLHLPLYLTGLVDGTIKARPAIALEIGLPCTAVMDADNALGLVAGTRAIDRAIELAGEYGLGAVAVRNSSHFGVAGYYADRAASEGLIAFSFTNASPAIAPTGGREARLGTNPIGAGFPVPDGDPIVVDLATAAVARSRIKQAATRGEAIPEGWALDPDGQPTTDPERAVAGSVLPIGGPKGYGLALVVELLCSAMSDNQPGFEVTYESEVKRSSRIGQFFLAMAPAGFVGPERYGRRVRHIANVLTGTPPLDPARPPRLPGSRGAALAREYARDGIPVSDNLRRALARAVDLLESRGAD